MGAEIKVSSMMIYDVWCGLVVVCCHCEHKKMMLLEYLRGWKDLDLMMGIELNTFILGYLLLFIYLFIFWVAYWPTI